MGGFVLPWIYIFGILMLPFETPRWLVLVTSFSVGYIMDLFTGPMGMHMVACTLLGYLQPKIQRIMAPREGYEPVMRPTIQKMGLSWYITYVSILTFIHHFALIFSETLRVTPFWYQIFHILFSSAASVGLMIVAQFLIFKPKSS